MKYKELKEKFDEATELLNTLKRDLSDLEDVIGEVEYALLEEELDEILDEDDESESPKNEGRGYDFVDELEKLIKESSDEWKSTTFKNVTVKGDSVIVTENGVDIVIGDGQIIVDEDYVDAIVYKNGLRYIELRSK